MPKYAIAAAGALIAVMAFVAPASADPVPIPPLPVITVPSGTTVTGLSIPDGEQGSRSITVAGCNAGGAVETTSISLSVPLGGGEVSVVPIMLAPYHRVPESGLVEYSLRPVSEWLIMTQPSLEAEIVMPVKCIDLDEFGNFLNIGHEATLVIPSGTRFGEAPPAPPVPSMPPTDVAPATRALAATGAPGLALLTSLAAGLGLLLGGTSLVRARSRARPSRGHADS